MKISLLLILVSTSIFAKNIKHILENDKNLEGVKICVVGDTGTGKVGQYKVANAMDKEGCTQVRIAGDAVYETGLHKNKNSDLKDKFLKPYKKLIEKGVTFHLVTGNHDYLGNEKLWNQVHKQYSFINHPNLYYAEVYQDICFINLDTTSVAHYYRIDRQIAQGKWLNQFNKLFKDKCKVTLAMGHHPNWSAGKHGEASKFFHRFVKRKISGFFDFYIAGHDHNLSHEGDENGTTFLVSGSGAKLRDLRYNPRGPFAKSVLGYVVFKVEKDNEGYFVNYQFKGVDENDTPYLLFEDTKKALGLR